MVTTQNRQRLARRAVASALAQTLTDLEVVVVDDASTVPVGLPPSPRVRSIRLDRRVGVCAARNVGIAEARGRWITFLDDDDELERDMLKRSLEAAAGSSLPEPVTVLSAIEVVDGGGRLVERRVPPSLARGSDYFLEDLAGGESFQAHNSLVVPTSLVRAIGGWNGSLRAMEHDDFFLRLNAVSSIQGVSWIGYRMTAHPGTRLSKDLAARADAMRRIVDAHEEAFARHPRKYADYLGTTGITCLRAGRWLPAVVATTRALRIDPRRPKAVRQWGVSLAGPRAWHAIDATRRLRTPGRGQNRVPDAADGVAAR
ncbi:MAG TPA: glycosyltransferase family 2 protein [Actinomycetota bacterium]